MSEVITFLYVWKKSNEFELSNSVKLVRKHYPDARICLVGDKPKTEIDLYIPHQQTGECKAAKTSGSVLHAATILDNFVLMTDDTFLNVGYNFTNAYHKGALILNKSLGNYNINIKNTLAFLNHYNKPIYNYECHQPFMFESAKLLELFDKIDYQHHHLMKSLYCNFYGFEDGIKPNLKTNNLKDAAMYYDVHRCFSTTDDINDQIIGFIRSLVAE
jgi:hypothetical protein